MDIQTIDRKGVDNVSRIKRNSGFTLIELLVVIAIIAIVSATAIPNGLNFVRNYQVIGAQQSIGSQMQLARAQAVKRNSRYGVLLVFDQPAAGQMQWLSQDPDPRNGGSFVGGSIHYVSANPGRLNPPTPYGEIPGDTTNHPNLAGQIQNPHGPVINLPQQIVFPAVGAFNALVFQSNGSIQAVTLASGAAPNIIANSTLPAPNNLDWEVRVLDTRYGLQRVVRISPNGRVTMPDCQATDANC